MKLNTKTRYGLRAMIEIARETYKGGIFQKEIAKRQNLSNKYLDHIIYALKVAGLITNVKGKKSGYILTKPASEIAIIDIYNAFEPGICITDCFGDNYKCERENYCAAKLFWDDLNEIIIKYFKSTTLQNLLDKQIRLEEEVLQNKEKNIVI
ncbi:RrF2 family transcriptional regulator [Thermophagus xiamenensis]|uniref:Transcriptional regulator, BadM/Rrf2 family n=1 Tax=Thermophagus xiamenensis TaxID=385682 RepID=A0A1I2F177_9BACT|nr:Rrf2 family transcriptional regulator [Thermophagus xiamenensis]SFE98270.1 transcriptional regulator, BadM/Rrf2 family [Thermophagus xiamenensis]